MATSPYARSSCRSKYCGVILLALAYVAVACASPSSPGVMPRAAPEPPRHEERPLAGPSSHASEEVQRHGQLERLLLPLVESVLASDPRWAVGIVLVDDTSSDLFWFGPRQPGARPLDAKTTFEIGSVSKVIAGLALADAIVRREVALSDPLSKHLGPGVVAPVRGGRSVTLLDLATHTAGFPRDPPGCCGVDRARGVTLYTHDEFFRFVSTFRLPSAPGERYVYSNVNTALLAMALEKAASRSYHDLLAQRIFVPLGMSRSSYANHAPPDANMLAGHDEHGTVMPKRVDVSPIGPCCAVRTTLEDMQHFLRAALGIGGPSQLDGAFALLAEPRVRIDQAGSEWATLGWLHRPRRGLLWKNGHVAGYRATLLMHPKLRKGAFVVTNTFSHLSDPLASTLVDLLFGSELEVGADAHPQFVVHELPSTASRSDVTFGDAIRLEGWIAPVSARRGDTISITFFYRCLSVLTRDLQIFVHGDDIERSGAEAKGLPIPAHAAPRIHGDHFPGAGLDSTRYFRPGELIRDEFEITIPKDYPARPFAIWTGLYDQGGRLAASSNKTSIAQRRALGPTIRVR